MKNLALRSLAVSGLALVVGIASAQSMVDGVRGPEWAGIVPDRVDYEAGNPGGFQTKSNTAALDVLFRTDDAYLYGLIETQPAGLNADMTPRDNADGTLGLGFANLYFASNPPTANGSNVGFEVNNDRAFVPGVNNVYYNGLAGVGVRFAVTQPTSYANGGGKGVYEFAIPFTFFTEDPLNVGFTKTVPNGTIQFRSLQAFGYNFIGSDSFGADRFGLAPVPQAVPEPASIAALALGGLALLRRRRASK